MLNMQGDFASNGNLSCPRSVRRVREIRCGRCVRSRLERLQYRLRVRPCERLLWGSFFLSRVCTGLQPSEI